jgi:hypothetical protein
MEVPRALPVGLHFSLTTIILLTRKRDVNPSALPWMSDGLSEIESLC